MYIHSMSNRILTQFNSDIRGDVKLLLDAMAASRLGRIKGQFRTIIDELVGVTGKDQRSIERISREYDRTYQVRPFEFRQDADLYLGMYNATVTGSRVINISDIKDKVVDKGLVTQTVRGVKVAPVEVVVRTTRFKPVWKYTTEYGVQKLGDGQPMVIEFKFKLSKESREGGATFSIFAKGRGRFSGARILGTTGDPKLLWEFMKDNYKKVGSMDDITVNNTTGVVKLGVKINLPLLYTLINDRTASFKNLSLKAQYYPINREFLSPNKKTPPFLYIKFGSDFAIVVGGNGSVGVEGKDYNTNTIKEFFDTLKAMGILTPQGSTQRVVEVKPPKTKLIKRANQLPAPNVTRRGSTCPINKRPTPLSFQGVCRNSSSYIRPNPQGQPCCYKIPKKLNYIRPRVIARYRQAGVKVPESVRAMFNFGANTNRLANNVSRNAPNLRLTMERGQLKIGSRQCSRYAKQTLVNLATRQGISLPRARKDLTKPRLCELLGRNVNPREYQLPNGGGVCMSRKKAELLMLLRALGQPQTTATTKRALCDKIKSILYRPPPRVATALRRWRDRSSGRNRNFNSLLQTARAMRLGRNNV